MSARAEYTNSEGAEKSFQCSSAAAREHTSHDQERNALLWHARMVLTPETLLSTARVCDNMLGVTETGTATLTECSLRARVIEGLTNEDVFEVQDTVGNTLNATTVARMQHL